jgi:hypothetical protein
MANRYWVGGTGTWNAANTINWSDVSNGAGGFSLPTAADDVFFDNFSNGTITIPTSNTGLAKSITCTNFTGTIQGTGNMTVSGNVTLSSSTTFNFNILTINSTSTITSAGRTFSCDVYINASGATVQLADNFSAGQAFLLFAGTFKTNNYNVIFSYFDSNNAATRVLDLGTSQLTSTNTSGACWQILQSNMTVNGSQATFNFLSASGASSASIRLGNTGTAASKVYGTINLIGTGDYSIGGIATINTIKATRSSPLSFYVLWNSDGTSIIQNFLLTGEFLARGTGNKILSLYNKVPEYSGNNRIILNNIYASNTGLSYTIDENNPYRVYAYNSAGANTAGIAFMDGTKKTAYLLTANTTWTVPPNWNNNDNKIYLIGAGGGGCPGVGSGSNRAGGAGGGGGGFTVINNFNTTPGNTITYSVGTSLANTDGGDTTWNSGSFVVGGGKRGNSSPTTSTGGAGGSGTYSGGAGGAGAVTAVASTGCGGGGGGGAAGIYGNGGQGGIGFANTTSAIISGGGGGGNGGGTNGSNGTSGLGGNGGQAFEDPNTNGVGSNSNGSNGRDGAGGAGAAGASGVPGFGGTGNDIESNTIGGGGGQGGLGGGNANLTRNIALYGGGGGGGSISTAGTSWSGGAGSNGAILIVYTSTPISPYAGRLYNDGTFMSGDSEFDEINSNNKFSISKLNNKIYANTFDEITINSSLGYNVFAPAVSDDLSGFTPTQTNVNSTTPSVLGPLGTTANVRYFYSTSNTAGVLHSWQNTVTSPGSSKVATVSIFAKFDTTVRYFNLTFDDGSNDGFYGTFDVLTGDIIGTGVNVGTIFGATSKYYGNGWWRFSVSGGINPSASFSRFSINILGSAINTWYPATQIDVNQGIFFAYLQLESRPFLSTLELDGRVPFANVPMRLETTNELFVENELDEVNVLL